jgi:hypothetical protein
MMAIGLCEVKFFFIYSKSQYKVIVRLFYVRNLWRLQRKKRS